VPLVRPTATVRRMWEIRSRAVPPAELPGVVRSADGWTFRWQRCALMGVVNVTPDSFSDGGEHATPASAIDHARRLVEDGATFVDIGGESTRPGAATVPAALEIERVVPVVAALAADGRAVVSIDSRKPDVVAAALTAGAHLVNDVGGLRDEAMVAVCAAHGVPALIMHMQGEPATMQRDPHYADVVAEVGDWLAERAAAALTAGVPSVIVDPGIGFGKTVEHNVALVRAVPFGSPHPVLVGASRKRTVQLLAGLDGPRDSDVASVALHLFAGQRGAAIVRVHDVAAHRQAFAVDAALRADG
jgi:dihydropteroate synthase